MTTELKNCPFCRSEAKVISIVGVSYVQCTLWSCACRGPAKKTDENAIAAWNKRAESEPSKSEPAGSAEPISANKVSTYARNLAMNIWRNHYQADSPNFTLLPDTLGVLTQIDNMAAGLTRKQPGEIDIGKELEAFEKAWPEIHKHGFDGGWLGIAWATWKTRAMLAAKGGE